VRIAPITPTIARNSVPPIITTTGGTGHESEAVDDGDDGRFKVILPVAVVEPRVLAGGLAAPGVVVAELGVVAVLAPGTAVVAELGIADVVAPGVVDALEPGKAVAVLAVVAAVPVAAAGLVLIGGFVVALLFLYTVTF